MNLQQRKQKIAEITNSEMKPAEKIKALQDFVNAEKQEEQQDSILTATIQDTLKSLATPQTQFIGVLKGEKPVAGVDYPIPEDGHTPTDQELLALIKPLIPKVRDGKTPTQKQLLELIRPLIPEVKDGETPSDQRLTSLIKQVLPEPIFESGEQILEKINQLPTDDDDFKIDASHIKNLPKQGKGANFVVNRGETKVYDLSSQLDGVTKTFNLPALSRIIGIQSSSFPNAFRPTVDYTNTTTSITFTSEITESTTLAAGQTLLIIYIT